MGVYISSFLPREDDTCSKTTSRRCSCRCMAGLTTSLRCKSRRVQYSLSCPDYWRAPLQPFLLYCLRPKWGRIPIALPFPRSSAVCFEICCASCYKYETELGECETSFRPFVLTSSLNPNTSLTPHSNILHLSFPKQADFYKNYWRSPLSSLSSLHSNGPHLLTPWSFKAFWIISKMVQD